jgi:hypothetical protein
MKDVLSDLEDLLEKERFASLINSIESINVKG